MTPASIRLPITRDGERILVEVAAERPTVGREPGAATWVLREHEAAEARVMLAQEAGHG